MAFRVITANNIPNHCTISRFRKDNEEVVHKLFSQVVELCAEAGLVDLGLLSIDGAKVKGNASLAANRRLESVEREVETILKEAEAKDKEEDRLFGPDCRGDELPEELRSRKSRLARLKECKERLEQQRAEALSRQREKIQQRDIEEEAVN